jgi:hypothetical protein
LGDLLFDKKRLTNHHVLFLYLDLTNDFSVPLTTEHIVNNEQQTGVLSDELMIQDKQKDLLRE